MLMNLRSFPCSSLIWLESAGNASSNSESSEGRLCAVVSNCLRPWVWRVKAVGSTILMATSVSCCDEFWFGFSVERTEVSVEIGEPRTDCPGVDVVVAAGEGVGGLEAVACDADYRGLVARDAG